MKDFLKSIREHLHLSQTELAEKLGVTFATVNRWENGRAIPTQLAQSALLACCKERRVPVFQMILQIIEAEAEAVPRENGRIVLFHGSKSGLCGPIEPKSREMCDFGRGFYMGTDPKQALTLICDFPDSRFYLVSVNMQALEAAEIQADAEWAMLVALHRGRLEPLRGTAFYEKYVRLTAGKDLVIGNIADDRMYYVLDAFFSGSVTDTALVRSLSALKLGKQYVAVSRKACDAVRVEKEIPLSFLERKVLQEESEQNRRTGIRLANSICREYRREGRYFDEILEEAKKGE